MPDVFDDDPFDDTLLGLGTDSSFNLWQTTPSSSIHYKGDSVSGGTKATTGQVSLNSFIQKNSTPSDANVYLNGTNSGSSSSDTTTINTKGGLAIGRQSALNDFGYYEGTILELVLYDFDQSSNRSDIESNINDYYDIY